MLEKNQIAHPRSISFATQCGNGILIREMLNENFAGLLQRDDPVFSIHDGPWVCIRILWPGYKGLEAPGALSMLSYFRITSLSLG